MANRILASFAVTVAGLMAPSASMADELAARLHDEAPTAWRALEKGYRQLELEAVCTVTPTTGDTVGAPHQENWKYKRNGPLQLFEKVCADAGDGVNASSDCLSFVFATNSAYGFKLTSAAKTNNWLLREASKDYLKVQATEKVVLLTVLPIADVGWVLPCGFLPAEMVSLPRFTVVSAGPAEARFGDACVRFEFALQLEPGDKVLRFPEFMQDADVSTVRGTLIVDPSKSWAIVHYDLAIAGRAKIPKTDRWRTLDIHCSATAEYSLAETAAGETMPVPSSVMFDWSGNPEGSLETRAQITSVKFRDIPENEFGLAAYGLPEPTPLVARPPSVAKYVFIAANILAISALLVARFRRSTRHA